MLNNKTVNGISFTSVSNGRYVIHFTSVLNDDDKKGDVFGQYATALKKARKIGGIRFHNKQYGGGIAFYASDLEWLSKQIIELAKD